MGYKMYWMSFLTELADANKEECGMGSFFPKKLLLILGAGIRN